MTTDQPREDTTPTTGFPTFEEVNDLLEAESRQAVYDWAVELLAKHTGADVAKIAIAHDGLLVPTASSNGQTERRRGKSISTSIPGSVFASGQGCVIPDLQNVRGAAATQTGMPSHAVEGNRSLVCAPIGGDGVIVALSRTPDVFDDEDLSIAETIGSLVSKCITLLDAESDSRQGGAQSLLESIESVVSHDMRNKLNVASGHLELLRETEEFDHISTIEDALADIESISDMVVKLAQSGQPVEELIEIDLASIVNSCFGSLDTTNASLLVKADATIMADETCLSQLLENLLRNAIEHATGPVRVEVGLLADGFYVADDGPGIPPEHREKVFEHGFSTGEDHDGVGLAIVAYLAEEHNWDISVTESFMGGARFEIRGVVFR